MLKVMIKDSIDIQGLKTLSGSRAYESAAAAVSSAAPNPAGSHGAAVAASDKVHCYGVHSCKGNSDCKTAEHSCKGQNACGGHGFKGMTAGACLEKGGVIADLKAK